MDNYFVFFVWYIEYNVENTTYKISTCDSINKLNKKLFIILWIILATGFWIWQASSKPNNSLKLTLNDSVAVG